MKSQADKIRSFLLSKVADHPNDIVALTARHFSVTKTTVHRHLNALIQNGQITKTGATRNCQYYLTSQFDKILTFEITPKLSEFEVWKGHFSDIFSRNKDNVKDICHYGFTEMFNNAIDHSDGRKIKVISKMDNSEMTLRIEDDGVGIFAKIADYLSLDDIRESVLQLSIGKLTTDPKNHTGEGIFFTSRSFDKVEIMANGLIYYRNNLENDWTLEHAKQGVKKGTQITLFIHRDSKQNLVSIFKKFQSGDDLAFDKTEITVALSQYGEEEFISRSQAKRILLNLEKFHDVTLDFQGVRMVGQGFVDEVFRIYASQHPKITIRYINANEDVEFMIRRSK